MSKTATVHAQQKWEYMELTRKTEAFLINDLNELGQSGWELVSISNHKAIKSGLGEAACWTAFLKRPHAGHPHSPVPQQTANEAAAQPANPPEQKPRPDGQPVKAQSGEAQADQSPEVFEFKD